MDDLENEFHVAWSRVAARFGDHADDLARRLARRRRAVLVRPPRAWCLALRASDARLAEVTTILPATTDDADAVSPAIQHSSGIVPHCDRVVLTAAALEKLCAPVHLDAPGETLDEVARKLGTTPIGLRTARLNGVFHVHHVQGLMGRRGRPVPLLYTPRPLDPSAKNFAEPDPAWLWTARYIVRRLPAGFEQTLTRIECYRAHVPRTRYADEETIHPEARDGCAAPKPRRRLPPPEPDHVWYKWSRSGHFLGDDPSNWRKSPQDLGERPPRWRTRRKQKYTPRLPRSAGSLHFNGYQWLCPICGKTCRTIYYPMPRLNLLDVNIPPAYRIRPDFPHPLPALAKLIEIPKPPLPGGERVGVRGDRVESTGAPPPNDAGARTLDGFACRRCHRVEFFSRCSPQCWNRLIAYLTCGLLYGHEVPRPEWFTNQRKRAFAPRPTREPSRRRPQVMELVLQGLPLRRVAQELGISRWTVIQHMSDVYAQHGVRNRLELARKLGRPIPANWIPRQEQIRRHLMAGLSYDAVARAMRMPRSSIAHYAAVLRQLGHPIPRLAKSGRRVSNH